ncbi:MAG: FAD-dependent oxidoreductase [Chloroflexi bacterium]|nr:FAD-dependent oxidoreductase [Chloroflexota bacterium]
MEQNANPSDQVYDVIIIGGGPAGSTAAIYTARAQLSTLVVDKGLTAGALGMAGKLANWPGTPGEVPGVELLTRMREQAQGFGAAYAGIRSCSPSSPPRPSRSGATRAAITAGQ